MKKISDYAVDSQPVLYELHGQAVKDNVIEKETTIYGIRDNAIWYVPVVAIRLHQKSRVFNG